VIPRPGDVSVAVYNAQGRLVRRLAAGHHAAGPRRVRWDARDTSGARVGPGVYFVRITARDEVRTRKVVLRR
jgi:flagellar hook assembly protein FlgD